MTKICPGLHQIPVGPTNVFLLEDDNTYTLVDAGPPGEDTELLSALDDLGVAPNEVENIVVTHSHQDHTGALRAVKEVTGADIRMHPEDAALVAEGKNRRPWTITPGPFHRVLYWLFVKGGPESIPPVESDHDVHGGQSLPIAGGIETVHVPGHCAGQLALLWRRHGGILFAADAALSLFGRPIMSLVYEDLDQGRDDLARLSELEFETAVFGHGAPIMENAAEQFRTYYGR